MADLGFVSVHSQEVGVVGYLPNISSRGCLASLFMRKFDTDGGWPNTKMPDLDNFASILRCIDSG